MIPPRLAIELVILVAFVVVSYVVLRHYAREQAKALDHHAEEQLALDHFDELAQWDATVKKAEGEREAAERAHEVKGK